MNEINREELIRQSLKLSDTEFSELLYALINSRNEVETDTNGDVLEGQFGLVKYLYGTIDGELDSEVEPYFVALPAKRVQSVKWGGNLCQFGRCMQCKVLLKSIAKVVVCPVCHAEGYCG